MPAQCHANRVGDQIAAEVRTARAEETEPGYGEQYGAVLYTHGPGIDAPLALVRSGYRGLDTATIIPLATWRGTYGMGTFADGSVRRCAGTQYLHLGELPWPAQNHTSYLAEVPNRARMPWFGSLIASQRDASGQLYRRNRYYDPQSGRFTQEDPIGIAGGLNTYAFADGDPVSYSDPYGLSAESKDEAECGICARLFVAALVRMSPRAATTVLGGTVAASRLVTGGGLQAHERMGGHTLARHVGRTVPQLAGRLLSNPKLTSASTFTNRAVAEASISGTLQANSQRVQAWLASASNARLPLNHDVGTAVGEVLSRGAVNPTTASNVFVLLQKNAASPVGYHIVTSYVTH
jgi:RHS repeat-associated protein